MKRLSIWFKVFLVTVITLLPATSAVLLKEREKKENTLISDLSYYNSLQKDLSNFKTSQDAYKSDQSAKNLQEMQKAQETYTSLLAQQPDLIKSNSTYVQPVSTSTSGSTSQTVSKPVSTRKTKTS